MESKTQKFLAVIILSVSFAIAGAYAINDFQNLSNDSTSTMLRECGINPVTGGNLNAR